MRMLAAWVLVLSAACGEDLGQAGDACISSAECGAGLLCDTALPKPVCALTGSPRPDLAMQPAADLAGVDLEGVDLSAIATDLSTAPSVDLAKRD